MTTYKIESLNSTHAKSEFSCGNASLDQYLKTMAGQDLKRHAAAVFVAVPEGARDVAGYYTLSATSIEAGELPPGQARKLPRYGRLPATLLGRLAVDQRHQGAALGRALLHSALKRSWENLAQIGSVAVLVDAIDDRARDFYLRMGFLEFPDHPGRLYLPMDSIGRLFA